MCTAKGFGGDRKAPETAALMMQIESVTTKLPKVKKRFLLSMVDIGSVFKGAFRSPP